MEKDDSNQRFQIGRPSLSSRTRSREEGRYNKQTLGLNGLVKEFDTEDKYGGSYDEDLEGSIRRFHTLSRMCEIYDEDKLQAIPIKLKGDSLDFFDDYQEGCETF